jgi:predicted RNA-binding protein with PUA-like domain
MRDLLSMQYWLVKQEPTDYSWADLVRDKKVSWTGVRNFQARKNLQTMRLKDKVLFYHSGSGTGKDVPVKAVVGIARVIAEHYPDPTAEQKGWVAVDLAPERELPLPVRLEAVKADPSLGIMALVRQSRLSVMPVTGAEFERVLQLGGINRIQAR